MKRLFASLSIVLLGVGVLSAGPVGGGGGVTNVSNTFSPTNTTNNTITLNLEVIENGTTVAIITNDLEIGNDITTVRNINGTYGISMATGVFSGNVDVGGDLSVTGAATAATLNTGQGANELYDMDQNVLTTSLPTFNTLTLTCGVGAATGTITSLTMVTGTATEFTATNVNVTYGVSAVTGVFSGAISATTINTGQGAAECYLQNQNLRTTDAVTHLDITATYGVACATVVASGAIEGTTVNTGQGAAECYLQNQNLRTTDAVTHLDVVATYGVSCATMVASGAIEGATINTGQGAAECYLQNQNLRTTDNVTFANLTFTGGYAPGYVVCSDSATITASSATVVYCSKNGDQSITLPTASDADRKVFTIKKTAYDGVVTILTNDTELIDGTDDPTYVDKKHDYISIQSDGTNWNVIGRYIQ